VIEEAPSPAVDAALRARLGDAALRLARAAGYVGAGTAEFLLDESGAFYFLEVNARLQVEHPVTEAITGRDLVADQLRIAAGEPLGFDQADVRFHGHAVEARIYAEDPWSGFLPSVGHVLRAEWPAGPGIRVDAGTGAGDEIGTRYDPMLAKVVSRGPDREAAIDGLRDALRRMTVVGVTTNRGFLGDLVDRPEFRAGSATTDLIERAWLPSGEPSHEPVWPVAAAALSPVAAPAGGSSVPPGFRLNDGPRLRVAIGAEERSVAVDPGAAGRLPWALDPDWADGPAVVVDLDGLAVRAVAPRPPTVESAVGHAQRGVSGTAAVNAPMPGVVLEVRVAEGDDVEAGQVLVVLEAMKMENTVTAPSAGNVARVAVEPGRQVGRGDLLVELQ
jgi:acetyl-CoA/propionyl-CoA carboxylase biotin carboxyl carrier protein